MSAIPSFQLPPLPARFPTREVRIGDLRIGGRHPVLIQSMTIADTCDTGSVVAEIRNLVDAGCPLIRLTAPSMKDAENLREIRRRLHADGIRVPMVADIHFTPNAAMVAAEIVEKVRINPGNYADRKKFEVFEISDAEYVAELERIRERFVPLVRKLKEHGAALRIGTNHGSLSDRIMNRFGDTPDGMVESALEFVRICRDENYHDIVLSMKSSIPSVMIAAYRLLVRRMIEEAMYYPLHIGVTEAGDGLEGRIKSAIGIGSLLATGIGDTIRVSLTEDSQHEIPAARAILAAVARERAAIGMGGSGVGAVAMRVGSTGASVVTRAAAGANVVDSGAASRSGVGESAGAELASTPAAGVKSANATPAPGVNSANATPAPGVNSANATPAPGMNSANATPAPGANSANATPAAVADTRRTPPAASPPQSVALYQSLPLDSSPQRRSTRTWRLRGFEIGGVHPIRVELCLIGTHDLDEEEREQLGKAGKREGAELISIRIPAAISVPEAERRIAAVRARAGIVPVLVELTCDAAHREGARDSQERRADRERTRGAYDRIADREEARDSEERVADRVRTPGANEPFVDRIAALAHLADAVGLPIPLHSRAGTTEPSTDTTEHTRDVVPPASTVNWQTETASWIAAVGGRPIRWRIDAGHYRDADTPRTSIEDLENLMPLIRNLSAASRDAGSEVGFVCSGGPQLLSRVRALAAALPDEIIFLEAPANGPDAALLTGSMLSDGIGDALCLLPLRSSGQAAMYPWPPGGRDWIEDPIHSAYRVLQACRIRLTRAEFIACPSCGRTQFDLQTTTSRIRSRTGHLSGVKIAIMGCIVNGPGEMADAHFGYVGSGPAKVDLYVGKERVAKSIPQGEAEDRLVALLREHGAWVDPPTEP